MQWLKTTHCCLKKHCLRHMNKHQIYVLMNVVSGCESSEDKDKLVHKEVMEGFARVDVLLQRMPKKEADAYLFR